MFESASDASAGNRRSRALRLLMPRSPLAQRRARDSDPLLTWLLRYGIVSNGVATLSTLVVATGPKYRES